METKAKIFIFGILMIIIGVLGILFTWGGILNSIGIGQEQDITSFFTTLWLFTIIFFIGIIVSKISYGWR